ncbi:MAG: peptidoglycan-binding protein [Verrucomicrobiota bacterium]|nr:peptidoglycan-binding protein [Verrucomicrobiota bacterium]
MKKFTNLLIVASLALAGAVMAQQPTPEDSPSKKAPDKPPAEVKPAPPQAPKTEAPALKEPATTHAPKADAPAVKEPVVKEPGMTESPAATKPDKKAPPAQKPTPAAALEKKANEPAATATPDAKKLQSHQNSKDMKSPADSANTLPSASPAATKAATAPAAPKMTATPATATASTTPAAKTTATTTPAAATTASTTPAAAMASATPAAAASASAAPSVAQTSPTQSVDPTLAAKKPDPQKVEQIKQQHMSFHAEARPNIVAAVTFSPNYRLEGSDRWQGPQYEVYRSYRPERHDQGYYRSHYQRVELIAGGYYYFNNNYWYPAWGYSPREEYYAYDAPIYVGKHAQPPDKVIADVQAVLQDMGYYKGEVDGLLGPLTRAALTGYQRDHGMTITAVIDEPTLDSLGMG